MTTLQKGLFAAALAAVVGTGIYLARQVSTRRSQIETLQQQQAASAEQVRQAHQERDQATQLLASLRYDNERLNRDTAELLKLRAEVTRLRADAPPKPTATQTSASDAADTATFQRAGRMLFQAQDDLSAEGRLLQMDQRLHLSPEQQASLRDILKRDPRLKKAKAELAALFTPEQQAAYEQLQQDTERDHARIVACVNALDVVQLLQSNVGLDQKQQEAAFPALFEYGQQKALYDEGKDPGSNSYITAQQHLAQLTLSELKGVLSDSQMAVYQKYQEQMLKAYEMRLPSETR
jgi:hypothetical protein